MIGLQYLSHSIKSVGENPIGRRDLTIVGRALSIKRMLIRKLRAKMEERAYSSVG